MLRNMSITFKAKLSTSSEKIIIIIPREVIRKYNDLIQKWLREKTILIVRLEELANP